MGPSNYPTTIPKPANNLTKHLQYQGFEGHIAEQVHIQSKDHTHLSKIMLDTPHICRHSTMSHMHRSLNIVLGGALLERTGKLLLSL